METRPKSIVQLREVWQQPIRYPTSTYASSASPQHHHLLLKEISGKDDKKMFCGNLWHFWFLLSHRSKIQKELQALSYFSFQRNPEQDFQSNLIILILGMWLLVTLVFLSLPPVDNFNIFTIPSALKHANNVSDNLNVNSICSCVTAPDHSHLMNWNNSHCQVLMMVTTFTSEILV